MKKKERSTAGMFIPGGLFLGMGLGFVYNNIPAGLFIGLGAGFILYVLVKLTATHNYHSKPKKLKKLSHKDHDQCMWIVFISAIFAIFGIAKLISLDAKDQFIIVFAWLLFSVVWLIIAIFSYFHVKGKC